jgi:cobalt/nickel transport system permease protein
MHLGNGAITPECAALTYGAAAVGLAASAAALRANRPTVEKLQLAMGLGCAVFAAQAINVPIAPGMSGHFVGGVLLVWALGPALGAWTMAVVLAAQGVVLGDGGIMALGANVLNMGLVPAGLVAVAQRLPMLRSQMVGGAHPTATAVAAGLAVVLAAVLIVAEAAAFRPASDLTAWTDFAARMIGYHVWISAMEGLATAAIVSRTSAVIVRKPTYSRIAIGLAAAIVLAVILLPVSSSLPDGYEAAAKASGVEWLLTP